MQPHDRLEPLAYTVAEAGQVIGVGRTNLYKAIKEGRLVTRRYGSRVLVLKADLERFLQELPFNSA